MDPDSIESVEQFFTNAERSLIVKEILDRTTFSPQGKSSMSFGTGNQKYFCTIIFITETAIAVNNLQ